MMANERAPFQFHEESFKAGWEQAFYKDALETGAHRCECFRCAEKIRALYKDALQIHKRRHQAEATRAQVRAHIYSQQDYYSVRARALEAAIPQIADPVEKQKAIETLQGYRERLSALYAEAGGNVARVSEILSADSEGPQS